MNRCGFLSSVAFALTVLTPRVAAAQFEAFLEKVNDVNFFFSCWHAHGEIESRDECFSTKNGYGLEVSFDVGAIKLPGTHDIIVKPGKWVPERKHATSDGRTSSLTIDSIWVDTVKAQTRSLELEVALGYSQFSGFRSKAPNIELRGAVREFPSVAVYGSFQFTDIPFPLNHFSPYFGIKSGFIELTNVQALIAGTGDTLNAYSATAKAFQLGGVYGLVASVGDRLHFFVEQAQHIRRLPNVSWDGPVKGKNPASLPRAFDFSGPTLSFGLQVTIKPRP